MLLLISTEGALPNEMNNREFDEKVMKLLFESTWYSMDLKTIINNANRAAKQKINTKRNIQGICILLSSYLVKLWSMLPIAFRVTSLSIEHCHWTAVHIDGWVQDRSISSALALEML